MSDAAHPHNRIPAEDLIADLQRVADDLEKTPTCYEYERHGRHSHSTLKFRFGSWNAAVETAGLEPRPPRTEPIPEEDLIADLQQVAADLGCAPTAAEYQQHGTHSVTTLQHRFGGWNNALDAAGIDTTATPQARPPADDDEGDDEDHPAYLGDRTYGTLEIFEHYWLLGMTKDDLPGGIDPAARGIPTRSRGDAEALKRGRVRVDDLWEEYLTEFQHQLVLELRDLRYHSEEVSTDG